MVQGIYGRIAAFVPEFTDQQRTFLKHDPSKPARLVAGPGAGKSFTCVAYMRLHANPPHGFPVRMRMLTFTRAAAAEFADKQRDQGLGEEVEPPSTVHAFALRILRDLRWAQIPQPVRIADDWETEVLIRKQLSRLLKAQGFDRATPSAVTKLEAAMSAAFESLTDTPLHATTDRALMNAYLGLWERHRRRLGYTLRSELPYRAAAAVEDHGLPSLHLDLLLVDEYQDLNNADIRLIQLVGREIPVIAIGDEDQSIYGYRNAAPEGIRRFTTDFYVAPENDYRLTISARCGKAILGVATAVIEGTPG